MAEVGEKERASSSEPVRRRCCEARLEGNQSINQSTGAEAEDECEEGEETVLVCSSGVARGEWQPGAVWRGERGARTVCFRLVRRESNDVVKASAEGLLPKESVLVFRGVGGKAEPRICGDGDGRAGGRVIVSGTCTCTR